MQVQGKAKASGLGNSQCALSPRTVDYPLARTSEIYLVFPDAAHVLWTA